MCERDLRVVDVAAMILAYYDELNPDSEAAPEQNSVLIAHLRSWLESQNRQLPGSVVVVVTAFVNAELDSTTPDKRGMGRMTEDWPRFAGKHRRVLTKLNVSALEAFRRLFSRQIYCGYLFAEYLVETFLGSGMPRDPSMRVPSQLLDQWVPLIYSASGALRFDMAMAEYGEERYHSLKGLWGHATGDPIHIEFAKHGIPVDEFERMLLKQYFDAGIVLRCIEAEPLSEKEQADVVTGGGYSACLGEYAIEPHPDIAIDTPSSMFTDACLTEAPHATGASQDLGLKNEQLAMEVETMLRRVDGHEIVRTLRADFEQDITGWFYDGVWRYFAILSEDQWSDDDSAVAEWHCRTLISFFQSFCAAAKAIELGYVPAERREWITGWLLRVNLGETGAAQAEDDWLPAFCGCEPQDQLGLFSAALGKCLPDIPAQQVILTLFAAPLVIRAWATIAGALGHKGTAATLHADAVESEQLLAGVIEDFSTGGGGCYVLENDSGVLFANTREYGEILTIWFDSVAAEGINQAKFGGCYRVVQFHYRALSNQLGIAD